MESYNLKWKWYNCVGMFNHTDSSRRRFRWSLAILGSLLLHILFLIWSQHTRLPGMEIAASEKLTLHPFKLDRVEINPKWIEPKLPPPEHISPTPSPYKSTLTPIEEKRTFAQLLNQAPVTSPTLPSGKPDIPQDKPIPNVATSEKNPLDSLSQSQFEKELQSTREQQLKHSAKSSAGRPILNVPGAPVPPQGGSKDLGIPTQSKIGVSQGTGAGKDASHFTGSNRLDDFFGPGGLPPPKETEKPIDTASQVPQSLLNDKPTTTQKYESLNPFLNVELFTYERSGEAGPEGYFLIRMSAKPNQHLQIIPKDIYYVLDVSSSIGHTRLNAFKTTVLHAIDELNPSDRFKIIAFRGKLIPFRSEWTSASHPPMTEIEKWFSDLGSGGVTDFYDGLKPLTNYQLEKGRMAMAMVMSDGVPTQGVLDSTRIINELSDLNDNKTSIFTFSSGSNVNNFLLDFLSYANQGRLKYAEDSETAVGDFDQLVQQVRNPLFLNLHFKFAGVDGDQVYPQNLPNLYQESPLLLFGRYSPGKTDVISLQILGDSVTATKELLVRLPIPKVPNGQENLPQTWARQRIYHLLSQMTRVRSSQESVLAEVRELSEKYQVEVPYF
jgi:hypothetical protein